MRDEPEPVPGAQDTTAADRVREALRTVGRQRNGATTAEICLVAVLTEDEVRAALGDLLRPELELHDHRRQCYKRDAGGPITQHGCETCRYTAALAIGPLSVHPNGGSA